MHVATVKMPQEEARKKLRACRQQLHKRADDEYVALEKGYAALAAGTPLIEVEIALRTCPVDETGRPLLAIARADEISRLLEFGSLAPELCDQRILESGQLG